VYETLKSMNGFGNNRIAPISHQSELYLSQNLILRGSKDMDTVKDKPHVELLERVPGTNLFVL
jgi:hypothetical protein